MNDIKFQAKNDRSVDQYWSPEVPIAVAKLSDLVKLLTSTRLGLLCYCAIVFNCRSDISPH